jgi:hypothetical protein
MPFALDNGAFSAFKHERPFDSNGYLRMLDRAAALDRPPLFCLVPDVVGDRDGTIRSWEAWLPVVRRYAYNGIPWALAFAAQDGMTPGDVPGEASVVFVGGSMTWKLNTLELWAGEFARVHVGRVNRPWLLYRCAELGIESVDGTGWWHTDSGQRQGLEEFLRWQDRGSPHMRPQGVLPLTWDVDGSPARLAEAVGMETLAI